MPESAQQSQRIVWALRRAFSAVEAVKESQLRQTGVSPAHYAVLINVDVAPGLTAAELARRLHLTPQNVGGLVVKLEQAGWIERRRHRRHGQIRELFLTDAGRAALAKAEDVVTELEAKVLLSLTKHDIDAFRTALESVAGMTDGLRAGS